MRWRMHPGTGDVGNGGIYVTGAVMAEVVRQEK